MCAWQIRSITFSFDAIAINIIIYLFIIFTSSTFILIVKRPQCVGFPITFVLRNKIKQKIINLFYLLLKSMMWRLLIVCLFINIWIPHQYFKLVSIEAKHIFHKIFALFFCHNSNNQFFPTVFSFLHTNDSYQSLNTRWTHFMYDFLFFFFSANFIEINTSACNICFYFV